MGKDVAARFKFIMEHAAGSGRHRRLSLSALRELVSCGSHDGFGKRLAARRTGGGPLMNANPRSKSPRNILVAATDFDTCAEAALDEALALARPLHATVYLFHAYTLPVAAFPGGNFAPTRGDRAHHRRGGAAVACGVGREAQGERPRGRRRHRPRAGGGRPSERGCARRGEEARCRPPGRRHARASWLRACAARQRRRVTRPRVTRPVLTVHAPGH